MNLVRFAVLPKFLWVKRLFSLGKAAGSMVIRVIAREFEGFRRSFAQQISAFQAIYPEIEVQCRFYPVEQVERMMVRRDPDPNVDVFLCSTDWLPELIDRSRLWPLNDYLEVAAPDGWPDDWHPSLRGLQTRGATVYGMPYHDGPEVLLYRRDWFSDESEKKAYRRKFGRMLKPPETWREFLEVAKYYTRPDSGQFGAVVAAFPDGHNLVYDFLLHLWSRGGELIQKGRPAFNDSAGREALTYYVRLFLTGVVSPDSRSLDSIRAAQRFNQGRIAMMWNWIGFALVAEAPDSDVRGCVDWAPVPRGENPSARHVTLNSYWVLTIPRTASDPEWSWKFIRHLLHPTMDRITATAGAHATRLSTWRSADIQETFPPYRVVESLHDGARTLPAIAQYPAINVIINQMMDEALDGNDIERCLHEASDKVADILESGPRQ